MRPASCRRASPAQGPHRLASRGQLVRSWFEGAEAAYREAANQAAAFPHIGVFGRIFPYPSFQSAALNAQRLPLRPLDGTDAPAKLASLSSRQVTRT